jgi:hypothetical protein
MLSDVLLVIHPVSGRFSLIFNRRTRQGFREELETRGGCFSQENHCSNFRIEERHGVEALIAQHYPNWKIEVQDNRAEIRKEGDLIKWAYVWEAGGYGGYRHRYGYVGTRRVFEVQKSSFTRDETNYTLTSDFTRDHLRSSEDTEALEDYAERWLRMFFKSMNVKPIT